MIICGTDNGLIYIRNIEDPKFEKIINAHTDAIAKEMKNVRPAFNILEEGSQAPVRSK